MNSYLLASFFVFIFFQPYASGAGFREFLQTAQAHFPKLNCGVDIAALAVPLRNLPHQKYILFPTRRMIVPYFQMDGLASIHFFKIYDGSYTVQAVIGPRGAVDSTFAENMRMLIASTVNDAGLKNALIEWEFPAFSIKLGTRYNEVAAFESLLKERLEFLRGHPELLPLLRQR